MTWRPFFHAFASGLLLMFVPPAAAEVREVRIAQQFGVAYLPLMVMKNTRLIERQADRLGVGPLKVTWTTFSSGADMNTALISGSLDFASGGVGPVLQIWGRTQGNLNVKGVASLGSLPLYLNTVNPAVKTLRDLSDKDRIALPAVKVSIQAVLLQMAAAQTFGEANYAALDRLTVSMSHPQATAALLSGTEITAHFTNSPFQEQQLQWPGKPNSDTTCASSVPKCPLKAICWAGVMSAPRNNSTQFSASAWPIRLTAACGNGCAKSTPATSAPAAAERRCTVISIPALLQPGIRL